MDLELDDSVVVITGGTDGLGAALAHRLVEEGARVAVCGRNEERLAAIAAGLDADDASALVMAADVTVPADIERFIGAVVDRWGRIDGLVNNAGKASGGPFESVSDEDWTADIDLKVMAAVR